MKTSHKKVLSFIRAIRQSFPDAPIVYTHGACYGLSLILKEAFPSAHLYMTKDEKHTITQINGRYYDIHGEYIKLDGTIAEDLCRLSRDQMDYWETVVSGQRLEHMLKKYKK